MPVSENPNSAMPAEQPLLIPVPEYATSAAPPADHPPSTAWPTSIGDAATPRSADADPLPPVVLSRAEDLAVAIERMRPIPRGGAMVEVEAPGLGAIRLHVAVEGDAVRIRIHAGSDALSWFAREHEGLCSAARQAVPESQSVDLQLQCGSDSKQGQSPYQGHAYVAPTRAEPGARAPAVARVETPTPRVSSSALVDVVA